MRRPSMAMKCTSVMWSRMVVGQVGGIETAVPVHIALIVNQVVECGGIAEVTHAGVGGAERLPVGEGVVWLVQVAQLILASPDSRGSKKRYLPSKTWASSYVWDGSAKGVWVASDGRTISIGTSSYGGALVTPAPVRLSK
jgi:hypothetical protein